MIALDAISKASAVACCFARPPGASAAASVSVSSSNGAARPRSAASWRARSRPDAGHVHRDTGVSVGYLPQDVGGHEAGTVLAEALSGFEEVWRLERARAAGRSHGRSRRRARRRPSATARSSIASRPWAGTGSRPRPRSSWAVSASLPTTSTAHSRSSREAGACGRPWPDSSSSPPISSSSTSRPTTLDIESPAVAGGISLVVRGQRGRRLPRPVIPQPYGHLHRGGGGRRHHPLRGRLRSFPRRARGAPGPPRGAGAQPGQGACARSSVSWSASATRRPRRARCRAASRCWTSSSASRSGGGAAHPLHLSSAAAHGRLVGRLVGIHKAYGPTAGLRRRRLRGRAGAAGGARGHQRRGQVHPPQDPGGRSPHRRGRATLGTHVGVHYYAQPSARRPRAVTHASSRSSRWRIRRPASSACARILGSFLFSGDDADKRVPCCRAEKGPRGPGQDARPARRAPVSRRAHQPPRPRLQGGARGRARSFSGTIVFISHDRYFINRIASHVRRGRSRPPARSPRQLR